MGYLEAGRGGGEESLEMANMIIFYHSKLALNVHIEEVSF